MRSVFSLCNPWKIFLGSNYFTEIILSPGRENIVSRDASITVKPESSTARRASIGRQSHRTGNAGDRNFYRCDITFDFGASAMAAAPRRPPGTSTCRLEREARRRTGLYPGAGGILEGRRHEDAIKMADPVSHKKRKLQRFSFLVLCPLQLFGFPVLP